MNPSRNCITWFCCTGFRNINYALTAHFAVQLCNCRDKAIVAYEKAAEANLRGGGTEWHAAKHLEDAAKLSAEGRNWSQTAEFTRQASQNYVDCGKEIPAAECLAKGARMLEEASPGQACELYKAAIAMYSRSEMAAMADDTVQRAVMVLLNARQPDDAASVLLQWASICHRTGSHAHMCRAYLGMNISISPFVVLSSDLQSGYDTAR